MFYFYIMLAILEDHGERVSEGLSERLGIDLNTAFSSKMSELEKDLSSSLENTS